MLERDIRAEHVEDVGLSNRCDVDVVVGVVVRAEQLRSRMVAMVLLCQAHHSSIVVDHGRVAG